MSNRSFKITNLSLKNKTTVFILTALLTLFGIFSYKSMPKSLYPDIVMPTIMVQTVYPGNSPADIENLNKTFRERNQICKRLEKTHFLIYSGQLLCDCRI